ncbi:MAG: hypothetical protein ACHQWU_03410 [Gemmatimonadales bacterium]|jgi:hypothetical protein
MAIDRTGSGKNRENKDDDDIGETGDVGKTPVDTDESRLEADQAGDPAAAAASRELSEELPVPPAMWPAEIDERARVVEALEDEHHVDPVWPRRDEGELRS